MILRGHGWPIVSRRDGWYELSFAREDITALVADYRGRARSMLRTSLRVRRVLERRAA